MCPQGFTGTLCFPSHTSVLGCTGPHHACSFYSSAFGLTQTCLPFQSCAREAERHAPGVTFHFPNAQECTRKSHPLNAFVHVLAGTRLGPVSPFQHPGTCRNLPPLAFLFQSHRGPKLPRLLFFFFFLPQPEDGMGTGSLSIALSRDKSGQPRDWHPIAVPRDIAGPAST